MLPESIVVAAGVGGIVLLLAGLAQVARWAMVFPVLVVGGLAGAWGLGALHPAWALDSLVDDPPWLTGARILAVQVGLALLAPTLLGVRFARALWLGAASPVLLGVPAVRALVARAWPGPRARAAAVLVAGAVTAAVPAVGPGVGATGWWIPDPGVLGPLVIALLAVALARGERPPEASAPEAWRPVGALVPVLLTVPFVAVITWLAALGGCLEFQATGLEAAPVYVPRITWSAIAGVAALSGALVDEATMSVIAQETFARALSLRGDAVQHVVAMGIAVGSGLPALVASGAAVRWALPFWLLQVVWVIAWAF